MSNHSILHQVPGLTYVGAPRHVFKLIHVSYERLVAWHPVYKWTQLQRGRTYTYNEAVDLSIEGNLPEEGRWYTIGELIYLVE